MFEFLSIHLILFPGLFPGLTFDTHELRLEKLDGLITLYFLLKHTD
jgi:hypothetical protein